MMIMCWAIARKY